MTDFLTTELQDYKGNAAQRALKKLTNFVSNEWNAGDLLSLDYETATVLVHDYQRQQVGGIPLGCFLVATRIPPEGDKKLEPEREDTSIILLRVIGKASLPNETETDHSKFQAAQRKRPNRYTYQGVQMIC